MENTMENKATEQNILELKNIKEKDMMLLEVKEQLLDIKTAIIENENTYKLSRKTAYSGIAKEISKAALAAGISAIIIGVGVLGFGGGIPFHKDKFKYVDNYTDTFDETGYSTSGDYLRAHWTRENAQYDSFSITTPFEKDENSKYKKTVYNYEINIDKDDLVKMYLDSDYKKIMESLKVKNFETIYKDSITEDEIKEDYKIEGKLFYKGNDYLYFEESTGWNIGGGIAEVVSILICTVLSILLMETNGDIEEYIDDLERCKKQFHMKLNDIFEQFKNYDFNNKIDDISINPTLKKEIKNIYSKICLGDKNGSR